MRRARQLAFATVAAAVVVVGLRGLVKWGNALPDGPEPIAWDRVACARCRMLVSEPAFAAQLQTRRGEVLPFDDPGCLLLHLEEEHPEVHAIYLHHRHEERWLPRERVAFVLSGPSPMGYDLGAVERGQAGALDWEAALERLRALEAARPGRSP